MTQEIKKLIENNHRWAQQFEANNPGIFDKLSQQQNPDYLWIGCSDSRVPANTIVGLQPGEVFVHRNIANQVNHADLNMLSVLEYAVKVLKVKDVILCGHYGCGGVKAALEHCEHGIVDHWLTAVKNTYRTHAQQFEDITCEAKALDRLCELNVIEQVRNICHTPIVQSAWLSGQKLSVHGVIYGIENGILKDLNVTTNAIDQVDDIYQLRD